MVPTSATREGSSLSVDGASNSSPKTTPTTPLPLPRKCFLSSPAQHGLGRSSLQSANDGLFQAIMSSISYRLETLSLSDEPVLEPPARIVGWSVYNATSAATHSTTSKAPARPRLPNIKPKLFERVSNGIRAGLRKSINKRRDLKKPKAPIQAPPRVSQCSPQDSHLGQGVDTLGGLSVSDAWEANPFSGDTRFHQSFTVAVRPAHQDADPTFLQPDSSYPPPATSTLESEGVDVAMDEDEQQPLSARPASPTPMDLEPPSPSNDATRDPQSGQAPFEVSANRDVHAVGPEPTDVVMSDEEKHSSDPDTDTVMSETASTETVSSTLFIEEVNRGDTEHKANAWLLERPTNFAQPAHLSPASDERSQRQMSITDSGRYSPPGTHASIAAPEEQTLSVQPPTISSPSTAPGLSPTVGMDANAQPVPAQRQVPLVETTKPTPAVNANVTSTSAATEQAATKAIQSTAGSSTPTSMSPRRKPTNVQEQRPSAHASRVHQVLGKMGLSKLASKSTMPSISEEASEDAETEAFLAKYKPAPRPKSQTKPTLPSPEPTQTKGNASRSLMDDIMAGLGRSTTSTSSQKQVTAVAQPTTRPAPPATNALSTSATNPSMDHLSLPLVAGRQTGSEPPQPSLVVGTSRYVAASPSSRAPATVPATGKVPSTPTAVLPIQQASIPLGAGRQTGPKLPLPSSVIGSGRQVAASPSSRAPSTVSATGKVNGPAGTISTQAGTPSENGPQGTTDETSDGAMDGVESGRRALKGSRRVARAMARMGLTWQTVQQKAQETQAALDLAQINAAASTTASSLERDIEEVRSREWHAAQPPPPPEAIPYISLDEEPFEGDENDDYAVIDWILRRED